MAYFKGKDEGQFVATVVAYRTSGKYGIYGVPRAETRRNRYSRMTTIFSSLLPDDIYFVLESMSMTAF